MRSVIDGIAWDKLEDAYGKANEVPGLLKQIARARGQNLFEVMDLLCSRVLHQGTIYSSSPPVARITVEFLKTTGKREKPMFYGLLSGFAEAPRQAIHDGRAIPCHAGGDPADGAAIRDEILNAHALFARDLANPDTSIRAYAAGLLTAFPDADPTVARLGLERYPLGPD